MRIINQSVIFLNLVKIIVWECFDDMFLMIQQIYVNMRIGDVEIPHLKQEKNVKVYVNKKSII